MRYPDSAVFYRNLRRDYPRIERGEGCWLIDAAGKRYLDACSGAFAASLGHGEPDLARALSDQAGKVAYVNGTAFTTAAAEDLAAELAGLNPPGLAHSYFLGSGSEAVEAALKLARQFWVETGKPGKHKIITQTPGYHGNTLLALSASARGRYRKLFEPWLVKVAMVPAPYAYRCPCEGRGLDCPACSGSALEEAIRREGPDSVAAFLIEPIGGSSTGACVPRPDYHRRVREICDRHQVLLIADEILCGAGRTGRWTGCDHFALVPDILVLGKGLSGGCVPLSAVCAARAVIDPIASGSGALQHAQTFSHLPTLCAAGLAAVRLMKSRGLIERAASMGRVLAEKLAPLKDLPAVGDVRGLGLLHGVEFVADKLSKRPFPRAARFAETLVDAALAEGLVLWPNVGHADGENGDLVMIAPPFIVTEAELDALAAKFRAALDKTLKGVPQDAGNYRRMT